jgi:hypothetical protein
MVLYTLNVYILAETHIVPVWLCIHKSFKTKGLQQYCCVKYKAFHIGYLSSTFKHRTDIVVLYTY